MRILVSMLVFSLLTCGLGLPACAESTAEPAPSVQGIVENMPLRQKVGQLFIVRPDALDFTQTQEQIDDAKKKGVLELTEEMRRLFEMACGTVDLAQKYLDTDALRELYYADGRPDRVETQRVSVKKPAAQPKPATTPAAVEEPIPPEEQPQGAEQLPEEQVPPELPEEQSHTQTVEPGADAETNGSGDSTDASDEPKDVEDAFCQDDEFDGSISEENVI